MKKLIVTLDDKGIFMIEHSGFMVHELVGIGEIIAKNAMKDYLDKSIIKETKTDEPGI